MGYLKDDEAEQMIDEDVADRRAFADAALSLAGHEIVEPVLRAIVERAALHELTATDAVALARRRVQDEG